MGSYPWHDMPPAKPEAARPFPASTGDWQVEDEHGALIGEYDSGRKAFGAAAAYLAGEGRSKVSVIYPDGFRLTERKETAKA